MPLAPERCSLRAGLEPSPPMSSKVLTAKQMREVDRVSVQELGIPGLTLMENAGRSVAEVLERNFAPLNQQRILVLCGKGNNGGDGFVVARHLAQHGCAPSVVLLADPGALKGEARASYDAMLHAGVTPTLARNSTEWASGHLLSEQFSVLVDAILGTGLTGPVDGYFGEVMRDINRHMADVPIVAVDIPSGLGSDSGEFLGESLRACCTVTFTAPKRGQVLPPSCERVGELIVAPIGTPASVYANNDEIYLNLLGPDDLGEFVRPRDPSSHKGD